jgi:hypothetical protein
MHIKIEEVAQRKGGIENREAFVKTGQKLSLDLVERLLFHTENIKQFL